MGLLDGVLGGIIGAGAVNLATSFVNHHGGVAGVVQQFEQHGLGGIAQSWVGNGTNLPVSPEEIQRVLGSDAVSAMAAKFGLSPQVLAAKLAEVLPHAVDQMTPGGVVPRP